MTKKETLESIRRLNEMKKAIRGEKVFSLNLPGCETTKKEVVKIPDLVENSSHSEALNIANGIWEKIKY
jgi:hypothetical protein